LEVSTKSLECAVVNESGDLLQRSTSPVSVRTVRDVIKTVRGSVALVFEEGELAGWRYRNLIYDMDNKSDNLNVVKLLKLFRGRFIQPVHRSIRIRKSLFLSFAKKNSLSDQ